MKSEELERKIRAMVLARRALIWLEEQLPGEFSDIEKLISSLGGEGFFNLVEEFINVRVCEREGK